MNTVPLSCAASIPKRSFCKRQDRRVFVAVVAGDERQHGPASRARYGGQRNLRSRVDARGNLEHACREPDPDRPQLWRIWLRCTPSGGFQPGVSRSSLYKLLILRHLGLARGLHIQSRKYWRLS